MSPGRIAAAALGAVLLLAAACGKPTGFTARHVALWSAGALGIDALGCGGDPAARTPAWDRLARRGAMFRAARAPGRPGTAAALATLLSGDRPPDHGVGGGPGDAFAPDHPTLAGLLADAGWRTAAFGLPDDPPGLDRGFATRVTSGPGSDPGAASVAWLRGAGEDAPWFVLVRAAADPDVAAGDRALGRWLRALERDGRLERTLVVATAECGPIVPAAPLAETTLRVPLVLGGPWPFRGGSLRPDPARLVDVYPTVLEALRVGFVQDRPGRALEERLEPWKWMRAPALAETGPEGPRVLVADGWRHEVGADGRERLFDLRADPAARHDVAAAEPDRLEAMRRAWRKVGREAPG